MGLIAQYDPERIEEERTPTWHTTCIPGLVEGLTTYSTAEHTLRFSLLFDSHHSPQTDITESLNKLLDYTIPRDKNGRRVQQEMRGWGTGPLAEFRFVEGAELSGAPPKLLLTYGGRTLVVRISSLSFEEVLFGTTPETQDTGYPTRVVANIEFIVADDERDFIDPTPFLAAAEPTATGQAITPPMGGFTIGGGVAQPATPLSGLSLLELLRGGGSNRSPGPGPGGIAR